MAGTRELAIQALRSHAPQLLDAELVELGHGLDHTAYAAGNLVLRVGGGGGVLREARLLEVVAEHAPIPVPAPLFADAVTGVLGYRRLPGEPLLGRPQAPGAARRLGEFLRVLHATDLAIAAELVPTEAADPAEWLQDLDGPQELLRVLHASRPRPSPHRVLAHADLGAEHILELDGALTGIIDWSDAAITDPALDFARLYRDFGRRFLDELLQAYGPLPDAMPRIEFFARCAALEDLAYGSATGRRVCATSAERSRAWLFPQRR